MAFMKIPNYSLKNMAIHTDADLKKNLQTPRPESPFQLRDTKLKTIRELSQICDADTKISNRDTLPTPLSPLLKNRSKIPRVEDHEAHLQGWIRMRNTST